MQHPAYIPPSLLLSPYISSLHRPRTQRHHPLDIQRCMEMYGGVYACIYHTAWALTIIYVPINIHKQICVVDAMF